MKCLFSEIDITPSKRCGRIVSLATIDLNKLYNGLRSLINAKREICKIFLLVVLKQQILLQIWGPPAAIDEEAIELQNDDDGSNNTEIV